MDLFFALSGFLITGILIDTKSAVNRASSFYGRRILRIFPVYYLTIAVVFVGEHLSPWIKTAANLQNLPDHLSYLFYFQNFIPMWHHGQYPESIIGPFWSLAIEEQFYLIWPMVVWRLAPRSIVKVCAGALCTTLTLRLILVPHFGDGIWLWALTPTRADGLFVGAALAAIFAMKGEFPKPLLAGMTTAGGLALGAVAVFVPARELWLTGRLMAVIGITGLALLCGALIVFCLQYNESLLGEIFSNGMAAKLWQVQLRDVCLSLEYLLWRPVSINDAFRGYLSLTDRLWFAVFYCAPGIDVWLGLAKLQFL